MFEEDVTNSLIVTLRLHTITVSNQEVEFYMANTGKLCYRKYEHSWNVTLGMLVAVV